MTDTIRYGASWGAARNLMSDAMRARVDAADRAYEREAAEERRERAERREAARDRAVRASIEEALGRGELFDVRRAFAEGGVGRTRAELLAYVSAAQDVEDAKLRRKAQREIDRVGETTFYEQYSADTSAPTLEEQAQARALLEKRRGHVSARARDRHIGEVARGVVDSEFTKRGERALLRRWGYGDAA